jgi:hypothetical protein
MYKPVVYTEQYYHRSFLAVLWDLALSDLYDLDAFLTALDQVVYDIIEAQGTLLRDKVEQHGQIHAADDLDAF